VNPSEAPSGKPRAEICRGVKGIKTERRVGLKCLGESRPRAGPERGEGIKQCRVKHSRTGEFRGGRRGVKRKGISAASTITAADVQRDVQRRKGGLHANVGMT